MIRTTRNVLTTLLGETWVNTTSSNSGSAPFTLSRFSTSGSSSLCLCGGSGTLGTLVVVGSGGGSSGTLGSVGLVSLERVEI